MNVLKILGWLSLLAAMLVSCDDPARCVEASRSSITDPSTPLSIGGTYGDMLATVVGERSGTLRWLESEPYVSGFPPPGETQLSVTIKEPNMAWDVELQQQGGQRNERLSCPSLLEADLEIELRSDDEVLNALIVAPVTFQAPDGVTFLIDITDEDLGMLEWIPVSGRPSLLLMLSYGSATAPEGSLRLHSAEMEHSEGMGMTVDLATWVAE